MFTLILKLFERIVIADTTKPILKIHMPTHCQKLITVQNHYIDLFRISQTWDTSVFPLQRKFPEFREILTFSGNFREIKKSQEIPGNAKILLK